MTPELINAIMLGGAALLGAVGGTVATFFTQKSKSRDQLLAFIETIKDDRQTYVEQLEKERAMYSSKLDRLWRDKRASRNHVAQLEDHIWQRKPPPPPPPPEDYVP